MKLNSSIFPISLSLLVFGACAAPRPATLPIPQPQRPPENETPVVPSAPPLPGLPPGNMVRGGPWNFGYTGGTFTYNIATEAQVATFPDTANKRTVPPVVREVTIEVMPTGESQVLAPAAPVTEGCDTTAALLTRAKQLIPSIPPQLSAGLTWSDSLVVAGCHGSIPATSTIARTYLVFGDTTFNGMSALLVKRTDAIKAKGEGAEGQHRIIMSAEGTGTTDLYFDVPRGRFLGSNGDQITNVDITTSGRLSHFVQHATERVILRTPVM